MELNNEEYSKNSDVYEFFSTLPYVLETMSEYTYKYFGMKAYEKGRWWYGEWEGHKRKVAHLWMPKSDTRILFWGWNYDYIPHFSGVDKIKYARTEKAFNIDAGECYMLHLPDFKWAPEDSLREYLETRERYEFPNYTYNIAPEREDIRAVFERNLPFMQEFFETVKTDEACLEQIDKWIEKHYVYALDSSDVTKAFILAKNGRLDEAEYLFTHKGYSFCDEKMLVKLREVYENREQ